MKRHLILFIFLSILTHGMAQKIIELPHQNPSHIEWKEPEKQFFSKVWDTEVVTNVATPSLQIFKPDPTISNGTSVIIAPGGALYAHSIESEGNEVAKWLNSKGITAFVLKYRLVPTGKDGAQEVSDLSTTNPGEMMKQVEKVLPLSIEDGLAAISYVRSNASNLGIAKDKIGFMGFSAGGAVTMGVLYNYEEENRPDFVIPVYPWISAMPVQETPKNAPPMLIVCASDDPLGLAAGSVDLYLSWLKAGKTVALHMYAKGGHGFGMRKLGLPSDKWIERFYDWSISEGITVPKK